MVTRTIIHATKRDGLGPWERHTDGQAICDRHSPTFLVDYSRSDACGCSSSAASAAASSASCEGLPFDLPAPAEAAPTAGNTVGMAVSSETPSLDKFSTVSASSAALAAASLDPLDRQAPARLPVAAFPQQHWRRTQSGGEEKKRHKGGQNRTHRLAVLSRW